MRPKGSLLVIGGAEDRGEETMDMENRNIRFKRYEILKTLLQASQKKSIEIITTASTVPDEVRKSYEKAFARIGHRGVEFIDIRRRSKISDKYISRVEQAGAIFFSGGDQFRLAKILGHTSFIRTIKDRYLKDRDFLLAGTSAGAMALSDLMIKEGGTHEAMIGGGIKLSDGLNIIPGFIIDTHFIKRGRFGRLAQAVAMSPRHLGMGLGEDTAIFIRGKYAECYGSGMVGIIDGRKISGTNIQNIKKGEPIFVENLKVHLYVKGSKFSVDMQNRDM